VIRPNPVPPPGRIATAELTGDGIDDLLLTAGANVVPTTLMSFDGASMALLDEVFAFEPSFTRGAFVDAN
jgi:hypothetical protein